MAQRFTLFVALALVAAGASACAGAPPPSGGPVMAVVRTEAVPLASSVSTPVPIVRAKPNPGAGRADPFVVLYAPPSGGGNLVTTARNRVAVSTFPKIPTLPGFEGGTGDQGPWAGVRVSGIVQNGAYMSAIIEAGGKSYIARPGDYIASRYRVLAIGPSYVRLSSPDGVRTFSLGG
jgi:hypothetical protein